MHKYLAKMYDLDMKNMSYSGDVNLKRNIFGTRANVIQRYLDSLARGTVLQVVELQYQSGYEVLLLVHYYPSHGIIWSLDLISTRSAVRYHPL